jgi:hypothetical protein
MSSDNSNTKRSNDGRPNRDGRRGGRSKRTTSDGGRGVEQSAWRALEKPYREWLVGSGIAVNTAAFNALSFQERVTARSAYGAERAALQKNSSSNDGRSSSIPDHFAPILLAMAMKNISVGWEKISDKQTTKESLTATTNSVIFYGLTNNDHCQVLGPDTKNVKNAHLWPYNNREHLPLIDLDVADIDNPKNILRLHSDIEHSLDRFSVTFVPSGSDFVVKILDPVIKDITLAETTITFADIDGLKLSCPSGMHPWRRILGTHSLLAHRKAKEKGHIPEDQLTASESSAQELMEFSFDEEAHARIQMVFRH